MVDNDDTASKILEVMNRERSGRVTFMPLNRLKSIAVQYPKANDALPMISKLRFDRAYIMAFEQVSRVDRTPRHESLQTPRSLAERLSARISLLPPSTLAVTA